MIALAFYVPEVDWVLRHAVGILIGIGVAFFILAVMEWRYEKSRSDQR